MRIIAGEMRSRKLKAPEGMDTRPTADRVKEALFSILGSRIYGARVLDLYGGSGALALEAVSRGADSAVICDLSAKACAVIQENIDTLNCGDKVKLLRMKDTAALSALQKKSDAFDLIFLDPPYRMSTVPICQMIAEYNPFNVGNKENGLMKSLAGFFGGANVKIGKPEIRNKSMSVKKG